MRATSDQRLSLSDLRRSLERLHALPIRPQTARLTLDRESAPDSAAAVVPENSFDLRNLDPGWMISGPKAPLDVLSRTAWWQVPHPSHAEILDRLWRNSVACGFAARRRAREAQVADPERFLKAGLLKNLGLWALAAVDLPRVQEWLRLPDDPARESAEREWLGCTLSTLGRTLGMRWKIDRLAAEAAWLGDDPSGQLAVLSRNPAELGLLREAFALANQTPWSLAAAQVDSTTHSSRVRLLIAEVQARTGDAFVAQDVNAREEKLTRDQARLILELRASEREMSAQRRFISTIEGSLPGEAVETWAERVGRSFCEDESIATARVVLDGNRGNEPIPGRQPERTIPLGASGDEPAFAEVQLWPADTESNALDHVRSLESAWNAWASEVAERDRLARSLDQLSGHVRSQVEYEAKERRRILLAALAEFAAGASHEMNNPLAVIVGRAQLLLTRQDDPEVARSLRTILQQAQRVSKILRDLMYVARPPEWRDRPCLPDEILRTSAKDLKGDADLRGVRLVVPQANEGERGTRVWTDPDPLRHVADTLIRNALEATPKGGSVVVTGEVDAQRLRWTVHDSGQGLTTLDGRHLFDPFYCGRQAGRGLGLGLPRAARVLAQAGGRIDWHSEPGAGTTFRMTLPIQPAPAPPESPRGNAGEGPTVPEA